MENLNFVKVRDVKSPERGTPGSAGLDFFVPNDFAGTHYLATNESLVIPSGIHALIPDGCALIAENKSGVAIKKGLIVGAKVADSDYQGEIFIHVINVSDTLVEIRPGDKIVQFLLVPILSPAPREIESLDLLYEGLESQRGDGSQGSTGTE